MKLDIKTGYKMIKRVYRKNIEEKLWQQWLSEHIYMDSSNFISFKDYVDKAFDVEIVNKPNLTAKEIIEKAEKIKSDFEGNKNNWDSTKEIDEIKK